MHADPPAASSVCVPSCLIVCFDLRHSTWSPSSSVPFPNTRHAPRCTSSGFIPPIPSRLCELLSKWREVKRKNLCSPAPPLLETKKKPTQASELITFSLNVHVGATHERNHNKIHLPYHCFLAALLKCSKVLQDLKHGYAYFV